MPCDFTFFLNLARHIFFNRYDKYVCFASPLFSYGGRFSRDKEVCKAVPTLHTIITGAW